MFLFHVATEADWAEARAAGRYERSTYGRSLAEVGFLHASASHAQLHGVLSSYYADVREPLRLLVIDPDRLTSPWRMDPVRGAPAPFPHVYGPLNLDAVVDTAPLTRAEGGRWTYRRSLGSPTSPPR
jgi:glutathione S-transferase